MGFWDTKRIKVHSDSDSDVGPTYLPTMLLRRGCGPWILDVWRGGGPLNGIGLFCLFLGFGC